MMKIVLRWGFRKSKSKGMVSPMAVASQQKNSQKSKRFSLGFLAIKKKRWC